MAKIDKTFQDLLVTIFGEGYKYNDPKRKGVVRSELMDYTIEHDFKNGFPAITLKKLAWKSVIGELLFFLRGQRNLSDLHKNNVNIWNKDGYNRYLRKCEEDNWLPPLGFDQWLSEVKREIRQFESRVKHRHCTGDLGPVYGVQWRDFFGTDQLADVIYKLKYVPMSTDLVVSAWNPSETDDMALEPCHYEFQIVARPLKYFERLNAYDGPIEPINLKITEDQMDEADTPTHGIKLIWSQRSVDTFLGLPFNIASYAALTVLIGKMTNTVPLGIKGNLKNVHLYSNSLKEAHELTKLHADTYGESVLELNAGELEDISDLNFYLDKISVKDFELKSYESFDSKKVEMLSRD